MGLLVEGPRLATVRRETTTVWLRNSGFQDPAPSEIEAALALPIEGEPIGGIVLHPDLYGLSLLFEEQARRLATHGFAVMAFDQWAAQGPFASRQSRTREQLMESVRHLFDDSQRETFVRVRDRLTELVHVPHIDFMGFCMGGMYAFRSAGWRDFRRVVSFYGMIHTPEQWRGGMHQDPIEAIDTGSPTLAILGGADSWTPAPDIEDLRRAWQARTDCQMVVYPEADHAFVHDPDRGTHRPVDAADAWSRALAFLTDS